MESRDVKLSEVKNLVGSLLTIVEAVCADVKQREASKILVKQTVFRWFSRQGKEDSYGNQDHV